MGCRQPWRCWRRRFGDSVHRGIDPALPKRYPRLVAVPKVRSASPIGRAVDRWASAAPGLRGERLRGWANGPNPHELALTPKACNERRVPCQAAPGRDACAAMPVSGSGAWSYSLAADRSPESKLPQTRSRVAPRIAPASRLGSLGAQQIEHRSQSGCILPGTLPRFRLERRPAHGTSLTFLPSFLRAAEAGLERGQTARRPAVPRPGHRPPASAGGLLSGPSLAGDGMGPGRVSSGLQVGTAALCPHPANLALALGRGWHRADSDSMAGLQGGLGKGPIKRCLALTGKGLRGIGEWGRSTSGFQHKCAARPSTRYPKIGTAIPTGPLLGVPPPRGYVGIVGRQADTICLWTGAGAYASTGI